MIGGKVGRRLMVISPHCDDAEIGAGGYIAKFAQGGGRVKIVVATVSDIRFLHLDRVVPIEERKMEFQMSCKMLGVMGKVLVEGYESTLNVLPSGEMVKMLDDEMGFFEPHEVLIPLPSSHQDHAYMYQVAVAACRPTPKKTHIELVAGYEYPASCWGPSSSMDSARGGMYVNITQQMQDKRRALDCYKSQMRDKDSLISWYGCDALAKLRGIESGFEYAELFYVMRHRVQ